MTRDVAERMNQLFLECVARLDLLTTAAREHYSPDQQMETLQDIARINAHLVMLMAPLYRQYPDLMPPVMRSN